MDKPAEPIHGPIEPVNKPKPPLPLPAMEPWREGRRLDPQPLASNPPDPEPLEGGERRRREPDPATTPSDPPTTPPDPPWWEREQGRLHGGRGRRDAAMWEREGGGATP